MAFGDSLNFGQFSGPESEIHAQIRFKTDDGTLIDTRGMDDVRIRFQMGAADELTLQLPSRIMSGDQFESVWRTDMSVWQAGSILVAEVGYDGDFKPFQSFEIVSVTNRYPDDRGEESLTVRGVSELARTARNKDPRVWDQDPGSDIAIIEDLADQYGWTNDVDDSKLLNLKHRAKESGKSDLDLLKLIAKQGRLGGPRVDVNRVLSMPTPKVGKLTFVRGLGPPGARRLHSLSMERDGVSQTRVVVLAWDNEEEVWIEKQFEADSFSQDPLLVKQGRKTEAALKIKPGQDIKNQGLVIQVVEHTGSGKDERIEVLNTREYRTDETAEELVKRYFEIREKLSRWATVDVDGHRDLIPYVSFILEGDLARMDKGHWLPLWCEHNFGDGGWTCRCRVIRIIDEENFPVKAVN